MGRASNRKKAQRQAGPEPEPDAATQEALLKVLTGSPLPGWFIDSPEAGEQVLLEAVRAVLTGLH